MWFVLIKLPILKWCREEKIPQSQIPFYGFDKELNYFANAHKITNACGNCKEETKHFGMMR